MNALISISSHTHSKTVRDEQGLKFTTGDFGM